MSASLHRRALFFYNSSSILLLKYENGKYIVSNINAILNIFKALSYILAISLFATIHWLTETAKFDSSFAIDSIFMQVTVAFLVTMDITLITFLP